MLKAVVYLVIACFLLISTSINAQTIFGSDRNAPKNGKQNSQPAMTPADYVTQIKAAHTQNSQALKNELKDELSKQPPLPPQPTIPAPTSGPVTVTPAGATPPPPNMGPNTPPPPPTVQNSAPAPVAPAPGSIEMSPQATQTDIYSGFQPSNTEKKNSSGQSSGGGWNINY